MRIADASLHYGEEEDEGSLALQGFNLEIARGEFAAVVGPSGCGKSTLMKLISGLTPRSSGHVTVDGVDVVRPLKTVGMAFHNSVLLPWRTVLENVLLPIQGGAAAPNRIPARPHALRCTRQSAPRESRADGDRRSLRMAAIGRNAAARVVVPRSHSRAGNFIAR